MDGFICMATILLSVLPCCSYIPNRQLAKHSLRHKSRAFSRAGLPVGPTPQHLIKLDISVNNLLQRLRPRLGVSKGSRLIPHGR